MNKKLHAKLMHSAIETAIESAYKVGYQDGSKNASQLLSALKGILKEWDILDYPYENSASQKSVSRRVNAARKAIKKAKCGNKNVR